MAMNLMCVDDFWHILGSLVYQLSIVAKLQPIWILLLAILKAKVGPTRFWQGVPNELAGDCLYVYCIMSAFTINIICRYSRSCSIVSFSVSLTCLSAFFFCYVSQSCLSLTVNAITVNLPESDSRSTKGELNMSFKAFPVSWCPIEIYNYRHMLQRTAIN